MTHSMYGAVSRTPSLANVFNRSAFASPIQWCQVAIQSAGRAV